MFAEISLTVSKLLSPAVIPSRTGESLLVFLFLADGEDAGKRTGKLEDDRLSDDCLLCSVSLNFEMAEMTCFSDDFAVKKGSGLAGSQVLLLLSLIHI